MPFTRRPLQTTITFVALNGLLCLSLGPVYDFVCDLPYWERRRERLRQERELQGVREQEWLDSKLDRHVEDAALLMQRCAPRRGQYVRRDQVLNDLIHNSITDMMKEVANEPSVGLYFVQQHVHKAVPGLLALKSHVIEGTEEAILYTQDVNDALASVKGMNEVGPTVFSKMISTLNASLQLLPTLYQSKTRPPPAYAHLPRFATHHGALAVPSSQPGTRSGVLPESSINIPEATGIPSRVSSPAEGLPAVSPPSSSSQGANSSSTTQATDTSSFVSGLLSSAYQRASSVRMSMPVAFEVKERVAKQDNATDVSTKRNLSGNNTPTSGASAAGYIPSIPYWNVFESAIQKAGHMVGAGSNGSGGMSDSSRRSPLTRSFSASNLPESAHKKSSAPPVEPSDFGGSSARREQEGLEKEENDEGHSALNLEDPQVVESYARLQHEQAAKLEAWLGNSKD